MLEHSLPLGGPWDPKPGLLVYIQQPSSLEEGLAWLGALTPSADTEVTPRDQKSLNSPENEAGCAGSPWSPGAGVRGKGISPLRLGGQGGLEVTSGTPFRTPSTFEAGRVGQARNSQGTWQRMCQGLGLSLPQWAGLFIAVRPNCLLPGPVWSPPCQPMQPRFSGIPPMRY